MITQRLSLAAIAAGVWVLAIGPAIAESYPGRPIKLIVGTPPGGPTDTMARLVAQRLSAVLGQPAIVDNRPGAGGALGTKVAAGADADGYTLLLSPAGPLTVSPVIRKNLGYDPIKSFAPVALVASSPQVLVVHPSVPARSVHELIAYAKRHPGQINLGIPGYGTQVHLVGELFKLRTDANIATVPYKGTAGGITDLLAGHVQMYFEPMPTILPLVQTGKLRALAILSERRHRDLPEIPTMVEMGFDEFVVSYWAGVVAPAGTPADIVDRLNDVIIDGLKTAEMQASLAKLGADPNPGSPKEFAAFISAQLQKWAAVVRDAGIKVD